MTSKRFQTRKGQVHITETIAVLFIFFVLVLFGIIFYFQYQKAALKERQGELLELRAVDTTLLLLSMPELLCSRGDAEIVDNCFDLEKLSSAPKVFNKHVTDYYFNLFSFSTITVQEVYPGNATFVLYDRKPLNYSNIEPTVFVVTLRNQSALEGRELYEFGYVRVEVYS